MRYLNRLPFSITMFIFSTNENAVFAQNESPIPIFSKHKKDAFPVVHNGKPVSILVDAEIVTISEPAASSDIIAITSSTPGISSKDTKGRYQLLQESSVKVSLTELVFTIL